VLSPQQEGIVAALERAAAIEEDARAELARLIRSARDARVPWREIERAARLSYRWASHIAITGS
jgi:hypothetical protein